MLVAHILYSRQLTERLRGKKFYPLTTCAFLGDSPLHRSLDYQVPLECMYISFND